MTQAKYSEQQINDAYEHCLGIARGHYENFPVASRLLPVNVRKPVAAIYAFARRADDYADEGDLSAEERLNQLDLMQSQVERIGGAGNTNDLVFIALTDAIERYKLPTELLTDLLSAFKQDVTTTRYQTIEEVYDYARRSANPVGRLMLHLTDNATEENLEDSDKICTALQLINFYQDVQQDIQENDRIYIPLQELESYELGPEDIRMENQGAAMQALMQFQYHRAKNLMESGMGLGKRLRGRFGFEIRAISAGGLMICHKLTKQDDLFSRPRLNKLDWLRVFIYALSR